LPVLQVTYTGCRPASRDVGAERAFLLDPPDDLVSAVEITTVSGVKLETT